MSSVLEPICRGLVGYVSYLAACRNSTVYSEYLLYEPLLRIVQAQGYSANCEVAVPCSVTGKGDKKRIDFVLKRGADHAAVEVKWIKSARPNIVKDVNKLVSYGKSTGASGYVLLFGQSGYFCNLSVNAGQKPIAHIKPVEWKPGRTKYSACWFRYV